MAGAGGPGSEVVLRGSLRVARGVEAAIALFTPVGERDWVPGWDPVFPAGEHGDGTTPGTVFLTGETIWVVLARSEAAVRYARAAPGVTAGMVAVTCRADGDGTRVDVTYAMTALTAEARPGLQAFADEYSAYLSEWERLIAAMSNA